MPKMAKKNDHITIEFDTKTVAKVTVLVVGLLMLIQVFGDLLPTLTLIATAFFLSIGLNPAVSKIASWLPSKSRKIATGVAFVLVVSFLSVFFSFVVPPTARQVTDFATDLPQTVNEFRQQDNFLSRAVERYELEDEISEVARNVATRAAGSDNVIGVFNTFTSAIINTVVVLVLTFMMLVEGKDCILAKERPGSISLWNSANWSERLRASVELVQSKMRAGRLDGLIDHQINALRVLG